MLKGDGSRILPVLAAVLVSVGLGLLVVFLLLREPDNRKFDEALRSAEFALQGGDRSPVSRQLLLASRYAVSSRNWKDLISVAYRSIPDSPDASDYRLLETLSGRGAASLPGDEDLKAYWTWSLVRQGKMELAESAAADLYSPEWDGLVTEVTLKAAMGTESDDFDDFLGKINPGNDPEFLRSAAFRSSSAELAYDAMLLYMYSGRVDTAYELATGISAGDYRWNRPDTADRRGTALALASVAQDYGDRESAIEWLAPRLESARQRRAVNWRELQMLGDFYWDRFVFSGSERDREAASEAWREAMDVVLPAGTTEGSTAVPDDAWRLWINQAVLEESRGRVRESRRLLDEALAVYPGSHEAKASWAIEMKDDEPALARRLARSAFEDTGNPVLGITAMQLDPDSVSPRLYEARLWELFEEATVRSSDMQSSDARIIATFLLQYMASRKNYSSIDVAVERYLRRYPDSRWILTWRLAADSGRGFGMVDLIAEQPGMTTPYQELVSIVTEEGSWRGLHDAAMYAVMTAGDLEDAVDRRTVASAGTASEEGLESAVLWILEPLRNASHIQNQPAGDRLRRLYEQRTDTEADRRLLNSRGRRGDVARSDAAASLLLAARQMRESALESLELALKRSPNLEGGDKAAILYLEALILKDLGRVDEARAKASQAVNADPEHSRARELLYLENVT